MSFSFVNSIANGKTLFVGEGNFSFCLSIAKQMRYPSNIIATTFERQDEFSNFTQANVSKLQSLGVRVFCNSDATKIHNGFAECRFNNIIFQFPHTGSREPIEGRNPNFILLRDFLKSAKPLLLFGGKVIITVVDSPYYQGAFQLKEAGKTAGYSKVTGYNFNPLHFPNYIHTMTNEDESAISQNDELMTVVFEV